MVSKRLHILGEVVDLARALELESATTQKSHETTSRPIALVEERKGQEAFCIIKIGRTRWTREFNHLPQL